MQLAPRPIGYRRAYRNILLAGVSLEQSLEASQGFESYKGMFYAPTPNKRLPQWRFCVLRCSSQLR